MIALLSPAKTLDFNPASTSSHTQPRLLPRSEELVGILRDKPKEELMSLMSISEKLASLNQARYESYQTPFTLDNAKQALLAFKGDVYAGMQAEDFTEEELQYAQQHIRILSGLYGLLRPLDLMQPYRLEMGTKLKNEHGKNLYEFWGGDITRLINEDLRGNSSPAVINLASKEYFSALNTEALSGPLYNVDFKEYRDGKYKIIAIYAKKARGMMARYMVRNQLEEPEQLKGFNMDGYIFNDELSGERDFIFTRES